MWFVSGLSQNMTARIDLTEFHRGMLKAAWPFRRTTFEMFIWLPYLIYPVAEFPKSTHLLRVETPIKGLISIRKMRVNCGLGHGGGSIKPI